MIQKLQGRYLRDEWRYDKYGAQGKILLLQEILQEQNLASQGLSLEQIINTAFPRTFSCKKQHGDIEMGSIRHAYIDTRDSFLLQEMDLTTANRVAIEEVAERFCTALDRIEDSLQ